MSVTPADEQHRQAVKDEQELGMFLERPFARLLGGKAAATVLRESRDLSARRRR